MHCPHFLWNKIQRLFKVIQIANNRNEFILVWVKTGRCDLRILSLMKQQGRSWAPQGTEIRPWGPVWDWSPHVDSHRWMPLCVGSLFSLLRPLLVHLHACGRRCLLHRTQVCMSLRSSHAQSLDTSLNSNSTFSGKFHINIAFLIPSKHYQMPEYTDIFWK